MCTYSVSLRAFSAKVYVLGELCHDRFGARQDRHVRVVAVRLLCGTCTARAEVTCVYIRGYNIYSECLRSVLQGEHVQLVFQRSPRGSRAENTATANSCSDGRPKNCRPWRKNCAGSSANTRRAMYVSIYVLWGGMVDYRFLAENAVQSFPRARS